MTYPVLLLLLAAIFTLAMSLAWAVAQATRQSGWIDSIWSFTLGGAGLFAALAPIWPDGGTTPRQWLVAGLVALWALRLGGHIAGRTRGGGDDPRYAHLRALWGDKAASELFLFLQIQALSGFLLALAVLAAARNPVPGINAMDLAGAMLLVSCILGEAVSDAQLARFRRDPANQGKVCDVGLWGLSRHPNYFFQWLGWFGYVVIGLQGLNAYPWGLVTLVGPAFMYALLVHLSGIPPLEAHMMRSRGDAFRAYQQRVSAFLPWRPQPKKAL